MPFVARVIGQLYASRSSVQDLSIDEITAGRDRFIYGAAVTEDIRNFENTPDVGLSLTLAWAALKP